MTADSLVAGAIAILETPGPGDKAAASHVLAGRWRAGGEAASRIALLHAIAHIELNALDLAWDLVARFAGPPLPPDLCDDWVRVADEEATHFTLIAERLASLGAGYGDLPAHDGLWQAAEATSGDLLARLAVVPMVLEARGLDVTPPMIEKFRAAGDLATVAALEVIYRDEIGHVASGSRWFHHLCAERGLPPRETWQAQLRRHFKGALSRLSTKRRAARRACRKVSTCRSPDRVRSVQAVSPEP